MKRFIVYAALAFQVIPTIVFAHDDVGKCTLLQSDVARLACFDEHFLAKMAEVETLPADGEWIVREETSPIDDSKNVFLSLDSLEPIRGRFRDSGPMVINIMCRENTTDLSIYFNGHHMSDYQYGTVTYRLDKEKAQKIKMVESTSNKHLGLWGGRKSIPFVKRMFGHSSLLIEATPYGENSVLAKFDIRGIESAIVPLREACNW